jgi:uncharacterized coiled-coil protein SlyX
MKLSDNLLTRLTVTLALQEKILTSVNVQWTNEHSSDLQMCAKLTLLIDITGILLTYIRPEMKPN